MIKPLRQERQDQYRDPARELLKKGDFWQINVLANRYKNDMYKHHFFFITLLTEIKTKKEARLIHYALVDNFPDYRPFAVCLLLRKEAEILDKYGLYKLANYSYTKSFKYDYPASCEKIPN